MLAFLIAFANAFGYWLCLGIGVVTLDILCRPELVQKLRKRIEEDDLSLFFPVSAVMLAVFVLAFLTWPMCIVRWVRKALS